MASIKVPSNVSSITFATSGVKTLMEAELLLVLQQQK